KFVRLLIFMNLDIQENIRLAEFTTLKIGGAARFFLQAKTEEAVSQAVSFAEENDLELFILGGGSNVLIADEGFDGLVLQIAVKGVSAFQEKGETVYVTSGAGEDWDEFVEFCIGRNLQGFECLSGIPGFVGGTPVQNVGAYGQEVSETIVSVRCFDRKQKKFVDLLNRQCGFAYRASIFNTTEKNRYIVSHVTFALRKNGQPKISYKDLRKIFGDKKPSLREARQAVLQIRAAKSMVIDQCDPNSQSAGSFFKNPIVSRDEFAQIEKVSEQMRIENVPGFAVDAENIKIPAAWLIEKSGFYKGFKFGKAGISSNHTLAIVNSGSAKAIDVLALKEEIQRKVKEKFGIDLKPEPVFVGFEKSSKA
ncbi:MAG TPA: UDP-N-acetylmuramate dehydrogenase, partial [Pyrinomonadaceae bacterium]|nr:UDP-N-acetylmuramate dehydrogenase [Pyrinomonadaceae bacterium]